MKIIFEHTELDKQEFVIDDWSDWFFLYRTVRDRLEKTKEADGQ